MAQKHAAYDTNGNITGFYDEVDSPLPKGVTAIAISDEEWQACLLTQAHTVQNGKLVAPTPPTPAEALSKAQSLQIANLRNAEQTTLTRGFTSNALGTPHMYPSSAVELQALSQAVTEAMAEQSTVNVWCQDSSGNWGYVPHTAAQVVQVQQDWQTFRRSKQQELMQLVGQVKAAATVAAVQAVKWA